MKNWLSKNRPAATAALLLLIIIGILLASSLKHNGGHLVYALDDPYIHMAMAKNFAQHSVWGVTKYHFSSSSSAPLWTLLVSVFYFVFGTNEVTPFILNLIFAVALLFAVSSILKRFQAANFYTFLALVTLIFFTPLPTLIFSGQEHVLHALLTILFAYFASLELSAEPGTTKNRRLWLLVMAPALSSVRYEGLFLAALVCLLFLLRRRWFFAILLGVLALLPPVIYGFISMSKGWFFFPNPILLKSIMLMLPGQGGIFGLLRFLIGGCWHMLAVTPHVSLLIASATVLFLLQWGHKMSFWNQGQLFILLFIGTALLHLTFANAGWFFRYEAYLIAFGVAAVSAGIFGALAGRGEDRRPWLRYAVVLLAALLPLYPNIKRGVTAMEQTRPATTNIYEQQYQMGLFLKQFYPGGSVAANDVGAVNFLADVDCLDLWGLGTKETAVLRFANQYGPEEVDALTRPADVIVVYEHDFSEIQPQRWMKAGVWRIFDNVVAAADSVTFFAPDSAKALRLMKNLKAFSPQLPKTVAQSGRFLDYIGP